MLRTAKRRIGPKDHGRAISDWDFDAATFSPGHRYELIDGRVAVANEPHPPECILAEWLSDHLKDYAKEYPAVIDFVTQKARVFVPGRRRLTIPEPDVACFRDFPHARALAGLGWHEVNPVLVAEVLVAGDPAKDLTRNVELYLAVPSIREYWVLDGREPSKPTMIRHVRRAGRWSVSTVEFGGTVTTPLLPKFALLLDPTRR